MKARRMKMGLWMAALITIMAAWSAPVLAQDGAADQEEVDDGLPNRADDDPLYWAEMREVYTIQQRAFLKEGRWAATLYAGMIPNNIFEQYFPFGLRVNYYILENLGMEFSTSYALQRDTDLEDIITDPSGIRGSGVLIGDTQLSHTTFGVQWSPVYGKLALFDSGLFYFDMFIFGGAGMVVTQTQSDFNADPDTTVKPEGVIGGGLALFMGQHAGLRIDFRQFIFTKVEGVGGVANPSEVSLGFSWFF